VWTSDPKRTSSRDLAKRSLTIGGLGSVGEVGRAASVAGHQSRADRQSQDRQVLDITVPLALRGRADELIE